MLSILLLNNNLLNSATFPDRILALLFKIPTGSMPPLQDLIPDLLVNGEFRLAQATSEQSAGLAAGIQSSVVLDVPFGIFQVCNSRHFLKPGTKDNLMSKPLICEEPN